MAGHARILLFASAREAVGKSSVEVEIPSGGLAGEELLARLVLEFPRLGSILAASRVIRNGAFVTGRRFTVRAGDEVAIHPPYSGG